MTEQSGPTAFNKRTWERLARGGLMGQSSHVGDEPTGPEKSLLSHVLGDFSLNSQSLALGIFQLDGSRVFVNPGMEELLWPDDQRVQGLERLMSPTFAQLAAKATDAAAQPVAEDTDESEPRLGYRGWIQVGSPTEFSRSVNARVWYHQGRIVIVGEHDISQLIQVEQETLLLNGKLSQLQREIDMKNRKLTQTLETLRETQAMLIHSEKMNAMGHLVAGVAHEVNNPVAFVASNLHGMRAAVEDLSDAYAQLESVAANPEPVDPAERASTVAGVRDEFEVDFALEDLDEALGASLVGLDRVKKLVENLRTFSRHDEADYKVMPIRESLDSTLALLKTELKDRVRVEIDLPDLPPIPYFGSQIGQVFMNLLLNATQAMDGEGTITIRGEETDEHISIILQDSGPGIPADILPKIFNPFFTTKPVGTGTGLGLYLCYKIVTEDHKGTMTAASEVGQGARFIMTLPKQPSA